MTVVCLCACIWVFNEEITGLLQPNTKIARQNKPVIQPSQLMRIADSVYQEKNQAMPTYQQGKAIYLVLGQGRSGNHILRIDPYSGNVISKTEKRQAKQISSALY